MSENETPGDPTGAMRDRPAMTPGYGIDRSTGGLLTWEWVTGQAAAARNYWVATTRPDGRPHVVPVWGLWLADTVYFSTDPKSRKGRNVAANPAAVIHLESGDDTVIFEGEIERATEADLLARFVDGYDAKYQIRPDPANPDHGFYRLRIHQVLAWREADFPTSATRWRFGGPAAKAE